MKTYTHLRCDFCGKFLKYDTPNEQFIYHVDGGTSVWALEPEDPLLACKKCYDKDKKGK
jgi:hypothetical protein